MFWCVIFSLGLRSKHFLIYIMISLTHELLRSVSLFIVVSCHYGYWHLNCFVIRLCGLYDSNLFEIYEAYSMAFLIVAAKSLQSCPTLCNPIDGSPPGSPIPGILQARTLEWVAISFSNAWKGNMNVKSLSRARLLATPWTAAHQPPPSMGFSRQEYF